MSLISDPDYLIHSLRLSYLRNVDDPYGARLISFDPSYQSNSHILAASLADVEKWPELAMPASPPISDDEGDSFGAPSGFPGATGLKYSQTIMGGRSGGLGLRIHGKRASTSKRMSRTPRAVDIRIEDTSPHDSTPTALPPDPQGDAWVKATGHDPGASEVSGNHHVDENESLEKGAQFVPKFKGAAEMEARRKMRLQSRGGPIKPIPPVAVGLNPELSSSDEGEDDILDGDDDDEFDEITAAGDDIDDGDEFDPEFAVTRTGANSDSPSDAQSVMSGGISTSNSSNLTSSLHANNIMRTRSRLSPVRESRTTRDRSIAQHGADKAEQPTVHTHKKFEVRPRGSSLPANASHTEMIFTRQKVPPVRPQKSALTAVLASSGRSSNPFAELYAAISGRAEPASMNVQVFFPHARQPPGKAMDLNVRKDATVEEVVGFALWSYWEEAWLPKLDEGLAGEDDPKWDTRLSAIGWIMRIAENDGEVDEDFPPPDRTGKISKFNFEAYAVLEASPAQVQQNQLLESKIQRRPSRTMISSKKSEGTVGLTLPLVSGPSTSAAFSTTPILSSSLGPSSSHGPQIFLRIRVAHTTDAVHISTTIPVSAGMYMQEALDLVCRKRKLDPRDYALVLIDNSTNILIPLDRTVASLQGKRELLLVQRDMLTQMGIEADKTAFRTTDPNASIFKRMSDVPEVQISAAMDYTAAYKKYTIYRKMPMLVTRQERGLAIDGAYIHIMPSSNRARAVFDSGKTTSFHIKSVVACQQSSKSSSIFKLVVQHDNRNKRYDFEAETPKLAGEIVQNIRNLKAVLERSGTVNRSRRSRQVV